VEDKSVTDLMSNIFQAERTAKRCYLLAIVVALLWVFPVGKILPPPSCFATQQHTDEGPSAAYLEALQVVNSFLWAWVNRDAESGLRLMSDRLRFQIKDESWLRQFVVGLSNPHHQAFEIGRGRPKANNRYEFSVTLYEFHAGERTGVRYQSSLEAVKEGQVWRVDHLPISSDNP